jgi:hypothetical protein
MKHFPARNAASHGRSSRFELVGQGAFECFDALEGDGYLG